MKYVNKQSVYTQIIRQLSIISISIIFLLIYSSSTSPLSHFYGYDSSFFILVGNGIKNGLLPYKDFFDMKGPYLFIIEWVGQLLSDGRTGAFLIQVINMIITLNLVTKIIQLITKNDSFIISFVKEIITIGCCLFIMTFTFEYGNLTEEFSLPPLLLSLYIALKNININTFDKSYTHPVYCSLIYGICFGYLVFIRLTNAAFIGSIILTVLINLIINKQYKNILHCACTFICGLLISFVPILLYGVITGTLKDMLYQMFIFGISYSTDKSLTAKLLELVTTQWKLILLTATPIIIALIHKQYRNRLVLTFAISSFIVNLMAIALGNNYLHYFTLIIPNLVFGSYLLLNSVDVKYLNKIKGKQIICLVIVLITFVLQIPNVKLYTSYNISHVLSPAKDIQSIDAVSDIKDNIPQDKHNKIYVFETTSCSSWYLKAELFPMIKYCDWQIKYMRMDSTVKEELLAFFNQKVPEYIVMPNNYTIDNNMLKQSIESNYSQIYKNENYVLLQAPSN